MRDKLQTFLALNGLVGGVLIAIEYVEGELVGSITSAMVAELEPTLLTCFKSIAADVIRQDSLELKVRHDA